MTAVLTASPNNPDGGTDITLSWSGIPSPSGTDWFTIEHAGDSNTLYLVWCYAGNSAATGRWGQASSGTNEGVSGSLIIPNFLSQVPLMTGSYEISLNALGGFTEIVRSNTIIMSGVVPVLTVSPSIVLPGGTVTVSWSSLPSSHNDDWMPFYVVGQTGGNYTDWNYVGSQIKATGSTPSTPTGNWASYTMPMTLGDYYFNYNSVGLYQPVATSNTVTVASSLPTVIQPRPYLPNYAATRASVY